LECLCEIQYPLSIDAIGFTATRSFDGFTHPPESMMIKRPYGMWEGFKIGLRLSAQGRSTPNKTSLNRILNKFLRDP
jgi:hypothetical protein